MTSELVERLRFQGRYGRETQDQMAARKVAERLAAADEIERLTAQLAEARQAERAAVVAFVREQAASADARLVECTRELSAQHFAAASITCGRLAAAIEAGDHLA